MATQSFEKQGPETEDHIPLGGSKRAVIYGLIAALVLALIGLSFWVQSTTYMH